jgi:hypothetical protein
LITDLSLVRYLIFSIWYCWTCAGDPKKQWRSGEQFGEHPRQRMCFLLGPPTYLSPTCADEITARDKVPDWVQRL